MVRAVRIPVPPGLVGFNELPEIHNFKLRVKKNLTEAGKLKPVPTSYCEPGFVIVSLQN